MRIEWNTLQSNFVKTSGDEAIFICPRCVDDSSGHLYVNVKTGQYYCFKCGLKGRVFTPYQKHSPHKESFIKKRSKVRVPPGVIPIRKLTLPLYEELLTHHLALKSFFRKKKITYSIARQYDLRFCASGGLQNRILLPIYFDYELVGWQARAIHKFSLAGKERKYQTPKRFAIKNYLYNWDRAREYPVIVIVEGAFDVFAVGPNAVATFGTSISLEQEKLLNSTSATKIVLWDWDARGKAYKAAKKLSFEMALSPREGPSALSPEEITEAVGNASERIKLASLVS